MEKYSVLISLYYKENPAFFRMAVMSIIEQTIQPDEIVLVEDGPLTDELYRAIADFKSTYPQLFTIITNEKNLGLGLALNVGLDACKNDLVARMDSDDISKPERCEKQLDCFRRFPDLSIVGSHVDEFVGYKENVISQRIVPTDQVEIYQFAKRRSAFNHPTVMYRKSHVIACGGYSSMRRNQDVDLFGRMLFAGCKAKNIDESLLWFRSSADLAERRKSWENTRSYIGTIKRFWKMGYSSFIDYLLVAVAQTVMWIMPISVQIWIYKVILRK